MKISNRGNVMMKTLMAAVVLSSAMAMAADDAGTAAGVKFVLGGDPVNGKAKFATICASCHGPEGKGDGPAGKALKPTPANFSDPANAERLTDQWVYEIIRDGGAAHGKSPLMVSWKASFKDQELRDLASYVRTLVYVAPAPAKAKPAKGKPTKK